MDDIDRIKSEVEGITPADRYWKAFSDKLKEIEGQYKDRMRSIFSDEKIAALVGENNVVNFKNNLSPDAVLGMIEIANNIRTSGGYGLSHNKQFYDSEGTPQSKTDEGTNIPNDYSITVRNHRTAGRSGGGIQLSFTGDGVPPETNIEDDGLRTDSDTGKTVEI